MDRVTRRQGDVTRPRERRRGPSPLDLLRADTHWCRDRLPSCRTWKHKCQKVKFGCCLNVRLEACFKGKLESCLKVNLEACLKGKLESCLNVRLEACLKGNLESCLNVRLEACL